MARMRTIKPEFWTDDKIVELSLLARLLFIGLWNFADDDGYLEHSPKRIKRLIFPDQDIDVEQGLLELLAAGFLCVCDSDQGELLKICKFDEHQRPQHPVRTKFTGILERNLDDSRVLMSAHEVSAGRVEESRVVKSREVNNVHDVNAFDEFWTIWPRKEAKAKARTAYARAIKKISESDLLAKAREYVDNPYRPELTFVPHATSWLNGERWNDPLAGDVREKQVVDRFGRKIFYDENGIARGPNDWQQADGRWVQG